MRISKNFMLIIDFKYLWKHSEKFPSAPNITKNKNKKIKRNLISERKHFVTIASGNCRDLVKRNIIHQSTKTK